MKRFLAIISVIIMSLFGFAACTDGDSNENGNGGTSNPPATASNVLVAYFSCTNKTEGVAKHI